MERNLEIKIKLERANGLPEVEIYEPESGDFHRSSVDEKTLLEKGLKAAVEEMFTKKVGDELYGWYIGLVEDLEYRKEQDNGEQKEDDNKKYVILWVDEDMDRDSNGLVIGGYEARAFTTLEDAIKEMEDGRNKITPRDREIVIAYTDEFYNNMRPLTILGTTQPERYYNQNMRMTLDQMTDLAEAGSICLAKSEPLIVEPDHINACYELWFDVDKVFGTDTKDNDRTVEFYTNYYPESGKMKAEVIVAEFDGSSSSFNYRMTDKEEAFLKDIMEKEAQKQGYATLDDMFILENELDENIKE